MTADYHLSAPVRCLLQSAEDLLETEIILKRQRDVPRTGYLVDEYLFGNDRNIILFPDDALGTLKDLIIAKHTIRLLLHGITCRDGQGKVLTFDASSAIRGMEQIYLDSLKDEQTRGLPLPGKKEIIPDLFFMFHEKLMELPWLITAHIIISRICPVLRNPQIYSLIRESMVDMHSLDHNKERIPVRYFVMHQGMYYARDMLLAYKLSSYDLHPEINIPELRAFRNLDVKQMMECRWSQSPWVHTKIVGEAMANLMDIALSTSLDQEPGRQYYQDIRICITNAVHRWMTVMSMQDWYFWDSPASYRNSLKNREDIRQSAMKKLFSE
jgi:hypothetical protein